MGSGKGDSFNFSFIHSFIRSLIRSFVLDSFIHSTSIYEALLCRSGTVLSAGETAQGQMICLPFTCHLRAGKQGECKGPGNVRCFGGIKQGTCLVLAQGSPPEEGASAAR